MHEAEELIRSNNLSLPISNERLIAALLPRVGLTSYPWIPRALPLGASRFGGPADLPASVDWPTSNGRPLLLLAQLNFGDLPIDRFHPTVAKLPKCGWLCLFLDVDRSASGTAGDSPGVVAMQFEGDAHALIQHDLDPLPLTETWTHCHWATVYPAHHYLCLPCADAVDSPLLDEDRAQNRERYEEVRYEIDDLALAHHEVILLGTPTLFNPDLRRSLPVPTEWMLLLEFHGECAWLAGASNPRTRSIPQPSFGSADYVQYFIRKSDYNAGRLDRGFLDYMLT